MIALFPATKIKAALQAAPLLILDIFIHLFYGCFLQP